MANPDAIVDPNEDFSKMKVVELKKVLKDRGLAISGTKDELIERLRQANEAAEKKLLEETIEEGADNTASAAAIDEDLENEIMNEESKVTSTALKSTDKRKLADSKTVPAAAAVEKSGTENKENKTSGETPLDNGTTGTDSAEPSRKIIKLSTITPEEKKELRSKKFGLTDEEKKEARAKRFGVTLTPSVNKVTKSLSTKENRVTLKKKGGKFALVTTEKLTPEELEKRKKRAERFGNSKPDGVTAKLSPEELEKRKKRAERFANSIPEAVAVAETDKK